MKVNYWKHEGVRRNGTFKDKRGAVETKPGMALRPYDQRMLRITTGRLPNGEVHGVTFFFETLAEWHDFLGEGEHGFTIENAVAIKDI